MGELTVTPLSAPGHSPAHTAFIAGDTAILGDSVFSPEIISKHGILYLYDAGIAYETLNKLNDLKFSKAVL